ncbi:MAG: antibiotic ABC transporter ATP-binding protein [Planctomycetes bacterium]|nr:antibiotic ABC transporter ATP-binding protein [Planctomycetota bacterium]
MTSKKPNQNENEKQRDDAEDFHVEEVIDRPFSRVLARRLMKYLTPYKKLVFLSIVLILITTMLSLVGPLLVKEAIDGPLSLPGNASRTPNQLGDFVIGLGHQFGLEPLNNDVETEQRISWLWLVAGLYGSILLIQLLFHYAEIMVFERTGQSVTRDLRMQIFTHLQRQSSSFFHRNPVGRLVTRVTNDVEALNELFASGFISLAGDLLAITGIVAMLFWTNAELASMVLLVTPVVVLATIVFRQYARKHYREMRRRLAHLNAYTQESISGMEVVQVCRREDQQAQRYSEINSKLQDAHLNGIFWYAIFFPTIELLSVVALVIIVVQGGARIEMGTATFGEFFLFWTYLTRLFSPLRDLAEKYNLLQSAMAASERIFGILDTDSSLPEPQKVAAQASVPVTVGDGIRFENVSFSYDGETPVLEDVSFRVGRGETVAVVGATGAGKSTIINLLLRFHDPNQGSIIIGAEDIRNISVANHRERFGLVLQDVAILSRTLEENIRFDRDINRDRIVWALEQVRGSAIATRQKKGLDEPMMERGRTISSGERQLVSFARALAGDPEILVLDEATSHVDTETEALIQEAIEKLVEGRTSVIVAHRLSTVRKADRILVMHHGHLREEGRHEELVALNGIYARLVKLQFGSS